jgi:hypothetical protein
MSTYVNFAVKADAAAVAGAMKSLGRHGFVAPAADGVVVFYDRDAEGHDAAAIGQVAGAVSKALGKPVLAALNDEDERLDLWLFEAGALADHYSSAGEKPAGGNAGRLAAAVGTDADTSEVESILRASNEAADNDNDDDESDAFVFATDRHVALAYALGLPAEYVSIGSANVAAGDDDIPNRGQFITV